MESSSLIVIYIAVFIPLIIIVSQRNMILRNIIRKKARIGGSKLDNILEKCVGKRCVVSTGSMGVRVVGIVRQVTDKWIEIECGKKTEILSLAFIQNVRIKEK
jgi:hypothetical protein